MTRQKEEKGTTSEGRFNDENSSNDKTEEEKESQPTKSGSQDIEKSVDELEKNPEKFADELEKRPKKEQKAVMNHLKVQSSSYSGPIPPPDIIKDYENILPGSADRIISMAEKQADHRRDIEKIAVKSGSNDSRLGIICGTIVCALVIASGTFVSWITNSPYPAATSVLGGLSSIVGVFIYGTRSNAKERKGKNEAASSEQTTAKKDSEN